MKIKVISMILCISFFFSLIGSLHASAESKPSGSGIKLVVDGKIPFTTSDNATSVLYDNGEMWIKLGENGAFTKLMDKVKWIASYERTYAVTESGDLYVIGTGNNVLSISPNPEGVYNSEFGYGNQLLEPIKIMSNVDFVTAVHGEFNNDALFAVTKEGVLYAISKWAKHLLNDGDNPNPVKIMSNVSYVDEFMILKDNGELWGWGYDDYGQLGDGNYITYSKGRMNEGIFEVNADREEKVVKTPKFIMNNVKYVSMKNYTIMAIKFDNSLWTWGLSVDQDTGTTNHDYLPENIYMSMILGKVISTPLKIMDNIKYVDHRYVVSNNGDLWDLEAGIKNPKKIMEDVSYVSSQTPAYGGALGNAIDHLGETQGYVIRYNGDLWKFNKNDFTNELHGGPSNPLTEPVRDLIFRGASNWSLPDLRIARNEGLTTPVQKLSFANNVTREQFCEIAVKLYQGMTGEVVQEVSNNPFKDTQNPEILKAYSLGIVNGISSNLFAPNEPINREQLASMMMRALTKSGKTVKKGSPKNFSDKNTISSFAKEPVNFMSSANVIKGLTDTTFGPKQSATIEQAVIMAKRLLELI